MKEYMLQLKKWAVLGATDKNNKYGYKIFKTLLENDYVVYPINPRLREIEEVKVYQTLKDVPDKIEVINFVVNPIIGKHIIEQAAKLGIKNIWLQPGTRSEAIDQLTAKLKLNVVKDCILQSLNKIK